MTAVFPGSFDPPTLGHVDVVRRASRMFSRVIVLVIGNPDKNPRETLEARAELLRKCVKSLDNVSVELGEGLLLNEIRRLDADLILRGLRGTEDYLVEKPVADAFLKLYGIETVFVPCAPELSMVSSHMVREILKFGGSVEGLVPPAIWDEVRDAYCGA